MVHAMGKAAAARITLRSVEELEALAESVPPMAYDIDNYATLGLLWETLAVDSIEQPSADDWRVCATVSPRPSRTSAAAAICAAVSARRIARRRRGCANCCARNGSEHLSGVFAEPVSDSTTTITRRL